MATWRREFARLIHLSAPAVATQLASVLLWTIDLLMVGRLGVPALNAVALGRTWVMGTSIVALGLVFGLDPFASQAHGARQARRLGEVLAHAVALAVAVTGPLGLLWLAAGPILAAFGQAAETAAEAHRYVLVQLPALPFYFAFMAGKQFLQARGIVRPAMWIALAANPVNALLNWLLIYGRLGLPRLEVVGAGLATAITQVLMLLVLWGIARRYRLLRGVRVDWRLAAIRRREIWAIARIGTPISIQLALEYWAFALGTLWAGRLGPTELASYSIALNLASISYMVPLGISFAAAARVGQRIGAGDRWGARRAAWASLALGGGVMAIGAAMLILGRGLLPALYSRDEAVLALSAATLPIVAAFQLFDGLQGVGGGVFRGMGQPRPAALANVVGYYALGLPLAGWLAFRGGLGLAGLWWGLALGLAAVAAMLLGRLAWRGPESVVPLIGRAPRA